MEARASSGTGRATKESTGRMRHVSPSCADDRLARGAALSEDVRREAHAWWKPAADRPHPVDILNTYCTGVPEIVTVWYRHMLASPLAYFERSAAVMAHDLTAAPTTGIRVQLCGDCRPFNFGAYVAPDRTVLFDVSSFGDTLQGPWEWDLKRLATGFMLAGRNNGFNAVSCRNAVHCAVQSYRHSMIEFAAMRTLDVWNAQTVAGEMIRNFGSQPSPKRSGRDYSRKRDYDYRVFLTRTGIAAGKQRIAGAVPATRRRESRDIGDWVLQAFNCYQHCLPEDQRYLVEQYHIVDTTPITAGVQSQPVRSFSLTIEGRDPMDTAFLQLTEATRSVLEPYFGPSPYSNSGQRVVIGQRLIQASNDVFLGWFGDDTGTDWYMRQVPAMNWVPDIEEMGGAELSQYAEPCGRALARAHARSGDRLQIAAYLGQGDSFDRAITEFADVYADQVEHDHHALVRAARAGHQLAEGTNA